MSTAQVPIVTPEDLQQFQAKHFPNTGNAQAPEFAHESYDDNKDDEDGLGYYPDGVKRTLTDEQIRIFRHSEIHAILRERQIKQENEEYEKRVSAQVGGSGASGQAGSIGEDVQAQSSDQTKLDSSAAGVKRPAAEAASKGSVVKRQATAPADMSLDYREESPAQQPTRKPAASHFAGRRIISYDD
ncbi:hypothetical protein BJX68DRAFT_260851 [Aspergillus pseudodeflectus]|uniref:Uncharacterized protein n=1 Tax=Aspergillus pseudodeflectus TaxID=176178 RepID=A0ABR4LBZ9_9EURO